jgi:Malectin domain
VLLKNDSTVPSALDSTSDPVVNDLTAQNPVSTPSVSQSTLTSAPSTMQPTTSRPPSWAPTSVDSVFVDNLADNSTAAPNSSIDLSTDTWNDNATVAETTTTTMNATISPTPPDLMLLALPIRINSGGLVVTSYDNATVWQSDYGLDALLVGQRHTNDVCAAMTSNQTISMGVNQTDLNGEASLYCSERWFDGEGGYEIPVPLGVSYQVTLYFAELVYTQPGQRVFDIAVEGQVVASSFDSVAVTGAAWTATTVSTTISVVADGVLSIRLTPIVGNPNICAVEVTSLSP